MDNLIHELETNNYFPSLMEDAPAHLTADILGGYASVFTTLVIGVIVIYGFIILINFLRDVLIKKEKSRKEAQIADLLSILHKLCLLGGYGFILSNVVQIILNSFSKDNYKAMINLQNKWDYLTFGIILIFLGIGFKVARKVILRETAEH